MNITMVCEIRGAKINPKSSFKNQDAQNTRGPKLREQIRYISILTPLLSEGRAGVAWRPYMQCPCRYRGAMDTNVTLFGCTVQLGPQVSIIM